MHRIFLLLLAVFFVLPAAAKPSGPQYAIALHGDLKYGPNFKHFDYLNPKAPKGGTLKQYVVGAFDSLNPFIVKGTPAAGLNFIGAGLVYESLMDQAEDEPFSMYGLLAETIEISKDGKKVTFVLRKEAKWQDGKPVTAQDVVWTFENLIKDGTPFYKAYYGDVASVKSQDERTVTFILKNTTNRELPLIIAQLPVLPQHDWADKKLGETTLKTPLGSGPYKIKTVSAGRQIVYERSADWWGKDLAINKGRYNFDNIVYDYYRDDNVALEAFFAGQYDVRQEMIAKSWETSYNVPQVTSGKIKREDIRNKRPQGMQAFFMNLRRPLFADRAVREAMQYALDFEWSNKQFAYGKYLRNKSYFENSDLASRGLPSADELKLLQPYKDKLPPELFTTEYTPPVTDGTGNNRDNLRKAAEILDKAGYKLGKDGVRAHAKTGVRLQFEIIDTNPAFERWISPMTRNLSRIGVKMTHRIIDPAQYQNRMNAFDYDVTMGTLAQSDSPGNEQYDYWYSAKADIQGSRNYMGIKNDVVDALVEKIVHAESRDALVTATHALDRVLLWNYYVIPQWFYPYFRMAYWQKLERPETISPLSPAVVESWWIKPEVKK
ncbi:MAG: ABC transporter substrate-binding protein [Alphaproteobacteria bacterium]|nr:ABC transporter substrate-binding protein [Alphaproteobacteria bacterium]